MNNKKIMKKLDFRKTLGLWIMFTMVPAILINLLLEAKFVFSSILLLSFPFVVCVTLFMVIAVKKNRSILKYGLIGFVNGFIILAILLFLLIFLTAKYGI